MAKVMNTIPLHQETEADLPVKVAIHAAQSAASQASLTAEQVKWMLDHKTPEILAYLAEEEYRRNSAWYLWGYDRVIIGILSSLLFILIFALILKIVLAFLLRIRRALSS